MQQHHPYIRRIFALGILCLTFAYGCKEGNIVEQNPIISATDERALGDRLYVEMMTRPDDFPILTQEDYPELYDYLNSALFMMEVATEIRDKFNWSITVIHDDSRRNAYTLPGGKIFVTTGMLRYLTNEYQLIALLAHEAYYADRPDQTDRASLSPIMWKLKEEYGENGTKLFIDIIKGDNPEMAFSINQSISSMPMSQDATLLADAFTISTICNHYSYLPSGLLDLIEMVEADGFDEFDWLENRPPGLDPSPEREQRLEQLDNLADNICSIQNLNREGNSNCPYECQKQYLP